MSRSYWLLYTMCMVWAGCTGDDYEPPPAVVIVDDEDMPGGVDSGVVSGGPGGMMGEEVDPVFKEWVETRAMLGQYDCSCSQGDGWRAIWDQQTCVNHWTRLIGGEETLGCQYNELVRTESAKARFYPYAQCHINNDRRLLSCLGTEQCQSDGDLINDCVDFWNVERVLCNSNYTDVDSVVMNSCRSKPDFPLISALSLSRFMRFGYNVTKPVTHPFGFDDINVRVLGSCSGSRCSSITLNFNENGTYKSFALIGLSDEYVSKGVYGLDDVGRIYFSEDCKESANMNVMFMFQRAFFNIISLKSGAGVLNDYGRNFLNAEYTIEEICGG